MRSHLGALQQEREKLKLETSNLAGVIAQGRQSPALLAELEKRELRLTEISDEIFSSGGNGLDAKLKEIEDFVMRRLGDIHSLLTEPVGRTFGWCRGPESNWLRPPFQGGALPVSYPGTQTTFLV